MADPVYIFKPDHTLGPCCAVEDCDCLADVRHKGSPWLCDEHSAEWLATEVERLRDTLTCVAQDCAHLEWNYQGKWVAREFQRVGRIAESVLPKPEVMSHAV